MGQIDILRLLREQPFQPFRILVSNNKVYDIKHPDLVVVSPTSLYIGIPAPDSPNDAPMDVSIVSMRHVVELKLMASQSK